MSISFHSRSSVARVESLESRRLLSASLPQFVRADLVSDQAGLAAHTDPNLVNAWGVAETKTGAVWVANNATGTSTVYDSAGNALPSAAVPQVVTIPPPGGSAAGTAAAPTGEVLNTGKGFVVSSGGISAPAEYLFDTEDGTISGWSPRVSPSAATLVIDNSASGAVYKGLALAGSGKKQELFATNFHTGRVEAYNSRFAPVALAAGAFTDASIPAGFAPFNIQNVGGKLYVTYAKQDDLKHDDVPGAGAGFVDVFDTRGRLLRKFAAGGPLNSPWAVSPVPGGRFKGDILVGNFGDGAVNVFNSKGTFLGAAQGAAGQPLVIPGLWGLAPGVGKDKKLLFFTAGPAGETHGIFGTLTVQAPPKSQHGHTTPATGGGTPTSGTPGYP